MMMIRRVLISMMTLGALALPAAVMAGQQSASAEDKGPPLEITADKSLEWDRNNKVFKAHENAIAEQGDVSIAADTLEAYYREEEGNSMALYKMLAIGNVKITSNDSVAYGDNAEYDIDNEKAVMTGKDLKMVSEDQTLTADENFEYYVTEGRLVANGDATIVRPKAEGSGKDTLKAQKISAFLKDNEDGKRVLEKMTAEGGVTITTPTETLTGNKGNYVASRNIAEITGDVTIQRGPNKLQGERATVNLTTNVSRMYGSAGNGSAVKRVRGVFYPGTGGNKKQTQETENVFAQEQEESAANENTASGSSQKAAPSEEPLPQSINRIRPKRPERGNAASPKQLEPVKLREPGSAEQSEEPAPETETDSDTQLLDVPETREPTAAPLTAPGGLQ